MAGENNPKWNGGIALTSRTERENFMSTTEYKSWRRDVFSRDEFKCQFPLCFSKSNKLEVHHVLVYEKYPQYRLVLKNGITVCKADHQKVKGREEKFEKQLLLSTSNR